MKKLSFTTKIIVITILSLIMPVLIMNYSDAANTLPDVPSEIHIENQKDLCEPNWDLYCWVVGSDINDGDYIVLKDGNGKDIYYNIDTTKSNNTTKLLTAYILATTDSAEAAYILEEAEKQYNDGEKIGNFYLER